MTSTSNISNGLAVRPREASTSYTDGRGVVGSAAVERFVAASWGAGVAECATLPIDIAKVRLQTQVPLHDGKLRYRGLVHGMYRVAADDSPLALWRGVCPALVRQVSYTGMSFVLYEPVRNAIAGDLPKTDIPFWKRVASGGIAGATSIFLFNPADVVKTQMQAKRGAALHMVQVARDVWKNGGITAMWRGWQPNVARCFVGNACELGCYDEFKTQLKKAGVPDGPFAHFGASGGAGLVSAIFSSPLDVVKTRLMAQAGGAKTELKQYKGVIDCFLRMPREEGLSSLYKGFTPLAFRKVAWTIVYFCSYEQALAFVRGSYS